MQHTLFVIRHEGKNELIFQDSAYLNAGGQCVVAVINATFDEIQFSTRNGEQKVSLS